VYRWSAGDKIPRKGWSWHLTRSDLALVNQPKSILLPWSGANLEVMQRDNPSACVAVDPGASTKLAPDGEGLEQVEPFLGAAQLPEIHPLDLTKTSAGSRISLPLSAPLSALTDLCF